MRHPVLALALLMPAAALGQAAPAPSMAEGSAFDAYLSYRDPRPADWPKANARVGRLGGHAGHLGPMPMMEPAPGEAAAGREAGTQRPAMPHGGHGMHRGARQ